MVTQNSLLQQYISDESGRGAACCSNLLACWYYIFDIFDTILAAYHATAYCAYIAYGLAEEKKRLSRANTAKIVKSISENSKYLLKEAQQRRRQKSMKIRMTGMRRLIIRTSLNVRCWWRQRRQNRSFAGSGGNAATYVPSSCYSWYDIEGASVFCWRDHQQLCVVYRGGRA